MVVMTNHFPTLFSLVLLLPPPPLHTVSFISFLHFNPSGQLLVSWPSREVCWGLFAPLECLDEEILWMGYPSEWMMPVVCLSICLWIPLSIPDDTVDSTTALLSHWRFSSAVNILHFQYRWMHQTTEHGFSLALKKISAKFLGCPPSSATIYIGNGYMQQQQIHSDFQDSCSNNQTWNSSSGQRSWIAFSRMSKPKQREADRKWPELGLKGFRQAQVMRESYFDISDGFY